MSTFTYLKNFFKDKNVASITPTSGFCVRNVTQSISFADTRKVVEYGPGTGVFTRYLLKQLPEDSEIAVFETNKEFCEKLEAIADPRLKVFHDGADRATELLPDSWNGSTDIVLSGIPFSFLDDEIRNRIITASYSILKENGQFLAYQTSGHLKDVLQHYFDALNTDMEWRNIPPMMIYRALKN